LKLGTLRSASPDGELIVVSRDLTRMVRASDIAPTLQSALDRWSETAPKLA
jgi:fumarylacetoacetate (FAA) hydrolase